MMDAILQQLNIAFCFFDFENGRNLSYFDFWKLSCFIKHKTNASSLFRGQREVHLV